MTSSFLNSVANDQGVALTMPKRLRQLLKSFSGLEWQEVLWSVGIGLASLLIGRAIAALLTHALERWSRRTQNPVDDAIVAHLSRPLRWLLPIIALHIGLPAMSLPKGPAEFIHHALLICSIIGLGWTLLAIVSVVEEVIVRRFDVSIADNVHARQVQTQFRGFRNIATFLIILVTLAFVLLTFERVRQLGAGLLASAGVAGIVIGFAAQRSLSTLLAGIQIALSQPIRVGDRVVVEGENGVVEEITLSYVVIKIWDYRRLIVPISYFIEKPFQNWTRASPEMLGTVMLYLDYTVPVPLIREELERIVKASKFWDQKTWALQVTDASEHTVTIRALVSAKDAGDLFDLRCEVREHLIRYVQQNYPGALPRVRNDGILMTGS